MKNLKIIAVVLVAFIATASFYYTQSASIDEAQDDDSLTTLSVEVKGVGCMTDVKTISKNVVQLEGVKSCDLIEKDTLTSFTIKMNPDLVTEEVIHAQIQDTPGCKNPKDRPYTVQL